MLIKKIGSTIDCDDLEININKIISFFISTTVPNADTEETMAAGTFRGGRPHPRSTNCKVTPKAAGKSIQRAYIPRKAKYVATWKV